MNLHRRLFATMLSLLCLLITFSGTTGFTNSPAKGGAPHSPNAHIEEIYAPFDTLRTDLSDYIWPTNASTVITSSFADYRRTHLHEGIDISTNNQKGYPVYASRDGYVCRIFISRRGYGKMLYVRHPDGFITMYAHLQRFQDPIDAYARKIQKQTRRYSMEVDLDPSMFPVSKGEVIAYTGNTGIGSAHLHFEVRDSSFNPINPFLLPQISSAISDEVPPVFVKIAFTPLGRTSKVQGRNKVSVDVAKKESSGNYVLSQPIKISGSAEISACVTDQSDVLKYRTCPYKFEMYIDDRLVFTSTKSYILESESHVVSCYYDKNLLRTQKSRFEKLYIESGNCLPFYNRLPEGSGRINSADFEKGEHMLRIVTWDLAGNESSLTAILAMDSPQN